MPKYIVSRPAIARCIESRSSRSPTTTSAPTSRSARARSSSFRTIARTALPCFNSSSAIVRPTLPTRPAAPVTRMGVAIDLPLSRAHRLDERPVVEELLARDGVVPHRVQADFLVPHALASGLGGEVDRRVDGEPPGVRIPVPEEERP